MESGSLMEREGVWIPLTPGKPSLTSEQGDGKESNAEFLCTECFGAMRCTEKCVMNEVCTFSPGMLDELDAGLGVAGKEPKCTTAVQDETSCVQEEAVKSSPSEHDSKKTVGADESHDGIGSIPTPSKTKETRKRRNDGNDMNKKASQRRRVKKHRPKIFDDSKPKKVPKAQTPQATSRPKTPKPATPNRVQERRTQSKKNKSTVSSNCTQKSTCSGIVDVGQDVQESSRASIVVRSCKRVLDFDQHPVNKESKSHEEPLLLGFDFEKFDGFRGKIVTSKRNTPRRSRFQNKSLKASDNLVGDNNTQQHEQESSITRKQEQVDKYGRTYAHYYQRRKKISSSSTIPIPTLLVYRRSSRKDLCLHNSKKCGPVFPKLFKKQRAIRKKVKIKVNHWYIISDELNKSLVNRSYGKLTQTTMKKVQNRVNKSKDKKGVVKPDVYIDDFRRVFLHPRRKRSITHTRLRESFRMVPCDLENYLLCQEENFLQITECLRPHEAPVQRVNSFTSPHCDFPRFNNSQGNLNWLQLQEAGVFESQSLPPEHQDILHSREDLYELQGAVVLERQCLPPEHKDVLNTREALYELQGAVVLERQCLPPEHKDVLHTREDLYELQGAVVLERQCLPPEHKDVLHTREDLYEFQGAVVPAIQRLPSEHKDILHTREDLYEFIASKVEDLTRKLASLDINNDQCKELVVRDQNVIGALVNVLPPKKRKMVPKVDLDNETLRVWKLLMENDESEPVEETDKDKEEWWEKQRNIFRGRVDSFIAKMHLIQGDRRFSPWKGSVTDSVVGVYLTQNVSDHLSSSAFMYLAARFPAKSRSKEVNDNFDVPNSQESVGSNAQMYNGCSKNNDMEQDMSASYADVSNETPTVEQDQNLLQVQDKPCVDENSITFRKLLEAEEEDYLKQFCRAGIDELESSLSASKLEDEEQRLSINLPSSNEPSAPTLDLNVSLCETSEGEFIGQQKSTNVEEPKVAVPISSLQSEVTIEQGVDSANNHKETLLENELKGKKINQKEKKQEPKTDWVEFKNSYCKTEEKESNVNCMDAVDWDAVRRAPVKEIAKIIEDRGMHNVIARRIQEFLERMHVDHGTHDLEWLRDIPPDKAKEFLLSIEGIGLKSVECVRLLTLHHNAFPVDTNVGRVATRLGWVPLQPLPDAVQIHLLNAYPMVDNIQKYLYPRLCTLDQKTLYELHYQLITFGKVFCTKRNPNCNACPMRAECRHYASAFASGRLALPGTKESSNVTSIVPAGNEEHHSMHDVEVNNLGSSYQGQSQTCEPIIEVPPSPEPEVESIIGDIEDLCDSDDDEIPTIRLNTEEFRETLKETMDTNKILIPEADMSKALIAFSAEAANIRVPPKKFVAKSRTMHLVYELPDFHPCLAGFEERDLDDPTPYLLAVWYPGEISKSLEYTENRAFPAASNNLEETVKATLLIPCRTANRGTFPLNGTYFQVNEVFADDETSHSPMDVPRGQLCNLQLRELGCGTSATSIFKALSTGAIQRLFWRGSICVRGFNRKTRQPRPLHRKFHISTTTMAAENRKSRKR